MDAQQLTPADRQLLEKFRQPYAPSRDEYERFVGLKNRGLVKRRHFALAHVDEQGKDTWVITPAGEDALLQAENVRCSDAEEKHRYKIQQIIAIVAALAPFIIFILGLIVEPDSGLVLGLEKLLRRWIK